VGDERFHHEPREAAVAVGEHLVAELVVAVFRKLRLDRVVAVRRERVGTQAVATAFDGREKRPYRLAADAVSRHQVLFEGHGVELARNGVAFGLWAWGVDAARAPAEQLRSRGFADGRAVELPPPRVHHPHAGSLAELRPEVEPVVLGRFVRRVRERHLGRRAAPPLVGERRAIHPDHLVEALGVAAFSRYQKDRRALVRSEPLPGDEELVALCFAAEDRVVVDDEAASTFVFLEKDRGGETADAAPDGDEVVHLAGVAGGGDPLFEWAPAVAQRVSRAQDLPGVAVRVPVVADAAVAVEGVGRGGRGRSPRDEQSGAGEEDPVEEVAAGDRLAQAAAYCPVAAGALNQRANQAAISL